MVSFRPTLTQAFGRGAYVGALVGLAFAVVTIVTWALGLTDKLGLPGWLAVAVPLVTGIAGGAFTGLVFGREEGADVDDAGIHPAPRRDSLMYAPWQRIADLRTERRSGRTRVTVYFDTGQIARLQAPYHGRWLAADPEFERKLFMLRHLWETHRSYTIHTQFPPDRRPLG